MLMTGRGFWTGLGLAVAGGFFLGLGRSWPEAPPLPRTGALEAAAQQPVERDARLLAEARAHYRGDGRTYRAISSTSGPPDDLEAWRVDEEVVTLLRRFVRGERSLSEEVGEALSGEELRWLCDMSRAVLLHAWWRFDAGDPEAAREEMLEVLALGQLIEHLERSVWSAVSGVVIQERALQELSELALLSPPAALELTPSPDPVPQVIIAECAGLEEVVWRATPEEALEAFDAEPELKEALAALPLRGLHRTRTASALRARCLEEAAQAALPWQARRWPEKPSWSGPSSGVGRWLDNPAGRVVLDAAWKRNEVLVLRREALEVRYDGVQTASALRRYRADRGRWPETLEALVPAYLDRIPRSPYDGQPLSWDPERAELWAALPDLLPERYEPAWLSELRWTLDEVR
jgi:hypothetical protein